MYPSAQHRAAKYWLPVKQNTLSSICHYLNYCMSTRATFIIHCSKNIENANFVLLHFARHNFLAAPVLNKTHWRPGHGVRKIKYTVYVKGLQTSQGWSNFTQCTRKMVSYTPNNVICLLKWATWHQWTHSFKHLEIEVA